MAKNQTEQQSATDPNTDSFPSFRKAMQKVAEAGGTLDGQVEHLEMHFLRNGELTWRVWIVDRAETEGGVLTDLG